MYRTYLVILLKEEFNYLVFILRVLLAWLDAAHCRPADAAELKVIDTLGI